MSKIGLFVQFDPFLGYLFQIEAVPKDLKKMVLITLRQNTKGEGVERGIEERRLEKNK